MLGDVCLDGIVEWARHGALTELQSDRDNEVAVLGSGV